MNFARNITSLDRHRRDANSSCCLLLPVNLLKGMLAVIRCRIFCLTVCYSKI